MTNATKLHYALKVNKLSEIVAKIKQAGFKQTKVRSALLKSLLQTRTPLSVPELELNLSNQGLKANKSTLYREITFLKEQGIIKEIQLGEDKKRFEIEGETHHHHLVCIKCEDILDYELERELDEEEQKITKNTHFKVLNHSLEFFGLCKTCQQV
ncbi:hypothetical protein A2631_04930 [Candidatus Daviesbacteria bacterium RIFCSPHIGHO2_01_FULL_44_29]|uniref:Transcriptional repressor n=1 Tax=Candidatus Daviesbacteria bacterium RIFCSPHIGHO2_02_FULL_43_12 TaxID=1797776 RepID=A0A1F5KGK3_9BACT|nr:MAG: hypothetical protein A2631_04930 [Candidatus Daviesbacteria bacterium RIFCSPHIGHO2_01_FULL_44_29]OGE40066.1 MAG: hypothetical protein A3D25_04660 [Candidatus Daviesbacteria bacterium RIFCSPHIGHO2_02_FULL_43_12]OGE41452.1 MAG: hypothetical protein A3E86_05150 [Candidatus Daviesbacteria bacterium RIFCSPHIGHO2_12_FULL_47_45]OGE70254.1 MAG: hypothetical protein A3B55_00910 [Candidatus Daviesbacteria bacterium RIFCSPLOWO2_01_FULL_43_15]